MPAHVLLVEDSRTQAELLRHALVEAGLEVEVVGSGEAALDLAAASRFDVVVCKVVLPGIDGFEVCRRLRAGSRAASAVRVAVLGLGYDRENAARAAAVGATAYLEKAAPTEQVARAIAGLAASRRVLLAEDERVNQILSRRQLESLGFQVEVVGNGEEAIRALARGGHACVLMDCHMPRLDGFEATERIRRSGEPWANVPIVALSAGGPEDQEHCMAAGMTDFVVKPATRETLTRALVACGVLPGPALADQVPNRA